MSFVADAVTIALEATLGACLTCGVRGESIAAMSDDRPSDSSGLNSDVVPAVAGPGWPRWAWIAGAAVLAVVLGLAVVGYRQPELLLEAINLRYCS